VVEIGGGSFEMRGHRVTLSEFNHELVEEVETLAAHLAEFGASDGDQSLRSARCRRSLVARSR
jgi:hypothetical protein